MIISNKQSFIFIHFYRTIFNFFLPVSTNSCQFREMSSALRILLIASAFPSIILLPRRMIGSSINQTKHLLRVEPFSALRFVLHFFADVSKQLSPQSLSLIFFSSILNLEEYTLAMLFNEKANSSSAEPKETLPSIGLIREDTPSS